jgi:hypothetical protein
MTRALARLSPTPAARRRTQVALRGTAPPRSSCFAQENQDARFLPECVKGVICELRLARDLRRLLPIRKRFGKQKIFRRRDAHTLRIHREFIGLCFSEGT